MGAETIERAAVLGAGTMGSGVAQACAMVGVGVVMRDVAEPALEAGLAAVDESLARFVKKQKLSQEQADAARARIRTSVSLEQAVEGADLVVEAIPEIMALKLETFAELDRLAPGHALLATNTSSLSVTEIAGATARPERVVGMHFFNPVPVMKLLEVVRGLRSSDEAIARATAFGERLGKQPIVVRDWPGFATSRLGVILGCEAIRMLEQGVASPADIDKAMELGYRHPMGPLRTGDLVGLDVRLAIAEHLATVYGERFEPPELLRRMVEEGKLGRKSGEGFYEWP